MLLCFVCLICEGNKTLNIFPCLQYTMEIVFPADSR
jgi:hypothetical protein